MNNPEYIIKVCNDLPTDEAARLVELSKTLISVAMDETQECEVGTPHSTYSVLWGTGFAAFSAATSDDILEGGGKVFWDLLVFFVEKFVDY